MAKERLGLTVEDIREFEMEISEAADVDFIGEEEEKPEVRAARKKAFIDNLIKDGKWAHIAHITGNVRYAKQFEDALQQHRKDVVAKSNGAITDDDKQKLVNKLVAEKEWGQLAYLLVEPDKRFNKEIANISVLLPPEFGLYRRNEAEYFGKQKNDEKYAKLEARSKQVGEELEAITMEQEVEIKKIREDRDKRIAELTGPDATKQRVDNAAKQRAEIAKLRDDGIKQEEDKRDESLAKLNVKGPETKKIERSLEKLQADREKLLANVQDRGGFEGQVESHVEYTKKIDSLREELRKNDEVGFFGKKLDAAVEAKKREDLKLTVDARNTLATELNQAKLGRTATKIIDIDKKILAAQKELEKAKAGDEKAKAKDIETIKREAEAKIAKIKEQFNRAEQGIKVDTGEQVEADRKRLEKAAEAKIESVESRQASRIGDLGREIGQLSKEMKEFKEGEKDNIRDETTAIIIGSNELVNEDAKAKSLEYLVKSGMIKEAAASLYGGIGMHDPDLRKKFLSSIEASSAKLDEVTQAVKQLGAKAKDAFVTDLIESGTLVGFENRLKALGMDEIGIQEVARTQLIKAGKLEPAYNILKGSKEGLKAFITGAQTVIQSYDDLKSQYDSFNNKGAATKALGSVLADSRPTRFTELNKGIYHALQADPNNVELKVSMAGILSDAHRATEARTDFLTQDEKQGRLDALNDTYKTHCVAQGEYPLGMILESYSQKGIYNALKVAAYEAAQIGAKVDVAGGDIAGVILYAPNLASFGKAKDALDKAAAKEGIGEELSIGDKVRAFFAPLLAALDIIPTPEELMNITTYITGLKRTMPPDTKKEVMQSTDAVKTQLETGKQQTRV